MVGVCARCGSTSLRPAGATYSGQRSGDSSTMTVLPGVRSARAVACIAAFRQTLIVLLTNVPTVSFGLSLAWSSLASGHTGAAGGLDATSVLEGAGVTHVASVAGVVLGAVALRLGRKPPLLAASAAFALCWALKLVGGFWCILVARLAAGLAGAVSWASAPLLATEVCAGRAQGAAAAAPVLAHNFGFLLMYAAADADIPHRLVLWCCLAVSVIHCGAFLLVPESPSYLAAAGKNKEARASLAWLRGLDVDSAAVSHKLKSLPLPEDTGESPFALIKELWQSRARRRALILSVVAVAGQECCGLLALMQFAEKVFQEAAGKSAAAGAGAMPARHALLLGAVQLVASALALYLLEKVGRRPLIVWTGVGCALSLCAGAGLAWGGGSAALLAAALAAAVAFDSLGVQCAPYAMLADMFHYRYRGCAFVFAMAMADVGNAVEVAVFGAVTAAGGVSASIGLAAGLTTLFVTFAFFALPETRGKTPDEIYAVLCPDYVPDDCEKNGANSDEAKSGREKSDANLDSSSKSAGNSIASDKNGAKSEATVKDSCVVTLNSDSSKETQWTPL